MKTSAVSSSLIPQRILVIRLDRLGDVVLSTPVVQQLRQAYPSAFIAMMVRPIYRELVEGNPWLNEVLLYDKEQRHRGIVKTIQLAWGLRRYRFDTALVLHPTHRSHWIPWFAGIPRRIGYDRKSPWLLTHCVPHRKQEGTNHEAEYTLELLRVLGLAPGSPTPVVPIHAQADQQIRQLLHQQGMADTALLVAMHPSASDDSKRWPAERFAQVADQLIERHQAHVVLVAGPEAVHVEAVEAMMRAMRHRVINLAGQLSVGELAAVLKRCRVLVSNDSGPVHIAAAVGTPVVAIFGRNQPGLGATRWGPLGPGHVILQKEGNRRFSYIDELQVEDVYRATLAVLQRAAGSSQRMEQPPPFLLA